MRWFSVVIALIVAAVTAALAQAPDYKNVGRTPAPEEIRAVDISISPDGKELPPGSGTAKQGEALYAKICVSCHGANLEGNRAVAAPALVGGQGTLTTMHIKRSIGSYWPYATTVWDYINRAMPMGQGGTLTHDEVYALTAFLLYKNGIVKEDEVMDAKTLPKIKMPNRPNFVPLNPGYDQKAVRQYGMY